MRLRKLNSRADRSELSLFAGAAAAGFTGCMKDSIYSNCSCRMDLTELDGFYVSGHYLLRALRNNASIKVHGHFIRVLQKASRLDNSQQQEKGHIFQAEELCRILVNADIDGLYDSFDNCLLELVHSFRQHHDYPSWFTIRKKF